MNQRGFGILLDRRRLREYDEKLLFFTRELGCTEMTAFGTLAPKSVRSRLLSQGGWFKMEWSLRGKSAQLMSLQKLISNPHLSSPEEMALQSEFLLSIRNNLPRLYSEPQLFLTFLNLTAKPLVNSSLEIRLLLFRLSMLRALGIFPVFTRCSVCSTTCSDLWRFSSDASGWIGVNCQITESASTSFYSFEDLIFINDYWRFCFGRRPDLMQMTSVLEKRIQGGDEIARLLILTRKITDRAS